MTTFDLDLFRERWIASMAAIRSVHVNELRRDLAAYANFNPDDLEERVARQTDLYASCLDDPERLSEQIASQMSDALRGGLSYEDLLEAISRDRRYCLRAATQLLAEGVPGAEIGAERLMRMLDIATGDIIRYHVRQMEETKARLERSFSASPLSAIEFDTSGLVTSWNASAKRIFGWSAAEAIGQNVIQLLVPPMELDHVNAVVAALIAGQFANSRNMNITKDGRLITCQWHNAQLRDDQDRVIGILSQTEDITAQVEREQQLQTFSALAANATDAVAVFQPDGRVTYHNAALRQMFAGVGDQPDAAVTLRDLVPAAVAAELVQLHGSAIWQGQIGFQRPDGSRGTGQLAAFPITDSEQQELALGAIIRDMTDQIAAESAHQELQDHVISAQRAALRELSTPLIPIAAGVVVMPLIGTIDADRAAQVLEALLTGVSTQQAEIAILDITGVALVDTQVADALMRAARAVGLLGGRVVLTGIRPEVAQTLVGLGVDLTGIVTLSTLQAGIAYALQQR